MLNVARRLPQRGVLIAACATAIVAGALASPSHASADGFPMIGDYLENQRHHTCLDADTNTWRDSVVTVQAWDCRPAATAPAGHWNQRWWGGARSSFAGIRPPGPPVGPREPRCLTARRSPRTHGGFSVTVRDCGDSGSTLARSQAWRFEWLRWINGGVAVYQVRNLSFGKDKCLDMHWDRGGNGAAVGLWRCHGNANQQWVVFAGPGRGS